MHKYTPEQIHQKIIKCSSSKCSGKIGLDIYKINKLSHLHEHCSISTDTSFANTMYRLSDKHLKLGNTLDHVVVRLYCLEAAAMFGNEKACQDLGYIYLNGIDAQGKQMMGDKRERVEDAGLEVVAPDPAAALAWFHKGAYDHQQEDCIYRVGRLIHNSLDHAQDSGTANYEEKYGHNLGTHAEALSYTAWAADLGYNKAAKDLGCKFAKNDLHSLGLNIDERTRISIAVMLLVNGSEIESIESHTLLAENMDAAALLYLLVSKGEQENDAYLVKTFKERLRVITKKWVHVSPEFKDCNSTDQEVAVNMQIGVATKKMSKVYEDAELSLSDSWIHPAVYYNNNLYK